jgi:hypothetical protein
MARALHAAVLTLTVGLCAGAAQAQSGLFGRDTLHGLADVRVSAADGETGWLDGGFGKTQASGGGGDFKVKPRLAEAALEWKPRLNFAVSGVVTAELQPQTRPRLDVGEAYLKLRAPPNPVGRFSARAGLMYPPVSMEHDGVAWTTPDMLSASALNSWIGEEVKVIGAEATFERAFGDHELSATAAVFGWNDTSGTLLTFRGWALQGIKTSLDTGFELPPLSAFMATKQSRETDPVLELDHRAGYYGRLEWRPPAPVSVNALYYDNAGDRIAVDGEKQWAWETRFLDLGLRWDVDERTKVLAQAMNGETLMGYRMASGHWVDMGFHAAYLLVARSYGEHALSGRVDWFETNDRTFREVDNNDEEGWALTGAWRHRLAPWADVITEVQHVSSKRPSRALAREAAKQDQTVLQTALRLSF